MNITDSIYKPSCNLVLPKKRLGILEQKTKSYHCLTRKEYEDFTTYIIYFLYRLAPEDNELATYKSSLYNMYEKHHMPYLETEYQDEEFYEKWLTQCEISEEYVCDNIDEIFTTRYKPLKLLTSINLEYKIDFVKTQIESSDYSLSLIDNLFAPRLKSDSLERIKNSYNSTDRMFSQDFIFWQAMKCLLFFTITKKEHKMIDTKTTEELLYRFINKSSNMQDETLMRDFMKIVPLLWF